ncbi:unnamed protein product, partial [Protopolystoma xenopodis]
MLNSLKKESLNTIPLILDEYLKQVSLSGQTSMVAEDFIRTHASDDLSFTSPSQPSATDLRNRIFKTIRRFEGKIHRQDPLLSLSISDVEDDEDGLLIGSLANVSGRANHFRDGSLTPPTSSSPSIGSGAAAGNTSPGSEEDDEEEEDELEDFFVRDDKDSASKLSNKRKHSNSDSPSFDDCAHDNQIGPLIGSIMKNSLTRDSLELCETRESGIDDGIPGISVSDTPDFQ